MKRKRKELMELLKDSLEEMKENQAVLLTRGDKIREVDIHLYPKMYHSLKNVLYVLERVETEKDVIQVIRHKNMDICEKHESFFMDLFETHRFNKLFELFEYE